MEVSPAVSQVLTSRPGCLLTSSLPFECQGAVPSKVEACGHGCLNKWHACRISEHGETDPPAASHRTLCGNISALLRSAGCQSSRCCQPHLKPKGACQRADQVRADDDGWAGPQLEAPVIGPPSRVLWRTQFVHTVCAHNLTLTLTLPLPCSSRHTCLDFSDPHGWPDPNIISHIPAKQC